MNSCCHVCFLRQLPLYYRYLQICMDVRISQSIWALYCGLILSKLDKQNMISNLIFSRHPYSWFRVKAKPRKKTIYLFILLSISLCLHLFHFVYILSTDRSIDLILLYIYIYIYIYIYTWCIQLVSRLFLYRHLKLSLVIAIQCMR